jgi:dihydrofolate reductase
LNTLIPHGLIDEYRLIIYPVVLGTGQRYFRDGNSMATLKLERAETTETGVAMLVLGPAA